MNLSNEFIELHNVLSQDFLEDSCRPVFLFGCAWRCGSTLLQRLISSSGEVFIWGENNALIDHLMRINFELSEWSSLIKSQNENYKERKLQAWIANLNPNYPKSLTTAASAYLLYYYYFETIKLGYKRWGFKEVRYNSSHAEFLLECFPKSRIIFLVRHLKDVLASNAVNDWYSDIGFSQGVTQTWIQNVSSFMSMNDERILLIKYEDLVENTDVICKLLEKHLILTNSLDIKIMKNKIRGASLVPSLGNDERKILKKLTVTKLLNKLNYTN